MNPALFNSTVNASKYEYREKARFEAEEALKAAKKSKMKAKSQAEAMTRLAKLWSPFDSRRHLAGVRVQEGTTYRVITEPDAKVAALKEGWAPTFAKRAVNSSVARSVLDKWAGTFNWSEALPPNGENFQDMVDHCGDAAPGPDGIPKAGWRATRGWGATTLHSLGMLLTTGVLPPISYNDGQQVFITKGEDEEDDKLVSRFPSETRPLTLKNDDNKIIAATFNFSAKQVLKKGACWIQRGFIPARQLVDNVVDVDSAARLYSMLATQEDLSDKDPVEDLPAMAFFDFQAAFPSLAHKWLFQIIGRYGFPEGFKNVIKATYHSN